MLLYVTSNTANVTYVNVYDNSKGVRDKHPGLRDRVVSERTCAQKVAVLNPANNQIIHLSVLYTWSGCKEVTRGTQTFVQCTGGRTFRSVRERWWFVAVSRCDPGTSGTTGLNISYDLHMTNGKEGDILHREFSADEFYILPIDISFMIAYLIITGVSIVFAFLLRQRQLFHTTYKMYMVSLILWTVHLFLYSVALGCYSSSGYKLTWLEYMARGFGSLSTLVFLLMIILMGKGYTITRGRLTTASTIKITVFFTLYTITYIVLFIYEAKVFDPGEVLYVYESPPGYGLIALRLIGWAWFCYSVFFTLKHFSSKGMFYYPFFIFYTLWFWIGPIVTLTAMFAIDRWIREKTVHSVDQFVALLADLFFLILTRPQAANKNFPYHVRTSQIGTLGTGENEMDSFSENPYAESRSGSIDSKAPDFTGLFTTSNSRSTDRLVPNESFSEFPCGNSIKVERSDAPPSYKDVMSPRRSLPAISTRPEFMIPPTRRPTLPPIGFNTSGNSASMGNFGSTSPRSPSDGDTPDSASSTGKFAIFQVGGN
ncbi:hypothetical protein FSP39_006021 [Pinctada imbricata]|uniref:Intimal thickness related receptor IRP domain-containing protein n=1 Tax=Pinctada imbricata TaxID=66713 RepID=A0AA89C5I9_PINIB|nr:hypothetical protein FSP39_006021 [Pinctada imbricata]